ncbi:MAG: class I SAM-dependent methyltransferase [Candidatus Thiodiazotropha lotti]|nr:class I SAM-dependent methyltransferase [Candidatus Thiodiazotropha lotti]
MATDYEKFYRENRHGLGEPSKEFVAFFDTYGQEGSKVLDVGCGQGRDALFIARRGHTVTAIDQSPSGIRDLQTDAIAEGLAITAKVADIRDYKSKHPFDVILVDRTLHMLTPDERTTVLCKLLSLTKRGTHILIADEWSNIPTFKSVLDESRWGWTSTFEHRGFLFVQRE